MISGFARFVIGLFLGILIIAITFLVSYIALKLLGVNLWING